MSEEKQVVEGTSAAPRESGFGQAEHHQLVIMGSGPAGLTAALYAARAKLAPVVYRGPESGGQLITTTDVENYPGFPEGVLGPDLMLKFEQQAARFGADLRWGTVTEVELASRPLRLIIDEEAPITADALIIATGASAKYLGLENEARLLGHGVSSCATCDGAFFPDVDVAVVGGGDSAMEEALFLTRFASRVYVIHRRDELRASRIMQERALAHEKIEVLWDTVVDGVLGDREVEGARIRNVKTGETSELSVGGFFLAIGHTPNTQVFRGWLDMDELGYIRTGPDSTRTTIPGVFACGDAQDHVYRQAVTAAGTGCMAAIDAERWLAERETSAVGTEPTSSEAEALDAVDRAG